jgi:hypothetical protein
LATATQIAVAMNSNNGTLEVFALVSGAQTAVYSDTQSGANSSSWNGWGQLSDATSAALKDMAVAANQNGTLQLIATDYDNNTGVLTKKQTAPSGSWTNWSSLGGVGPPPSGGIALAEHRRQAGSVHGR